ncbi:hypothetical protein ID866_4287 [Astraeus odoratus]|nr:hypothetical protein ID866_4287 [Astraeus odoratus]
MAMQSRPEPMNASPHHSKVRVTLTLSDPIFVAGGHISGKMEVESRADLDCLLGIGVMMVELYAIEEIISRDHTATTTFIHSRRIFQGPGLPPSNAVYTDYTPTTGELSLPAHHHAARRGLTTFFFRFPLPHSSPASIKFGPASIRYEVRASVSVAWRGDKRLVTDTREVKVVESLDALTSAEIPQAVTIAEGGKLWVQASIVNGTVIGGEAACIELEVKNHTPRWTCGVTLTLTRTLHLSDALLAGKPSPDISDLITQVDFQGPEYSVPPGIEGVASLVVDIPRHSRGAKGGPRLDDNGKATDYSFEVRCAFNIRIQTPPGSHLSEDVVLSLPVTVHHSLAVPEIPVSPSPIVSPPLHPYVSPLGTGIPYSPPPTELLPYHTSAHDNFVWQSQVGQPICDLTLDSSAVSPINPWLHSSYPYIPPVPQRPTSAGPPVPIPYHATGSPTDAILSTELPVFSPASLPYSSYPAPQPSMGLVDYADTPGKGPRASRISHNLHQSARHRSVSPCSYKYPLPDPPAETPLTFLTRPYPLAIPITQPSTDVPSDVLYSPRPIPSPKHSFSGSAPRNENVFMLEHMADEVGKQTSDLSADLPKGDVGVRSGVQGPIQELNVDKALPGPPVSSGRDRPLLPQRLRADTLFTEDNMFHRPNSQASSDNFPHAPPTPPIAAITPVKFPRGPTENFGLGVSSGKNATEDSGLDALERRLVAEVGTRRLDTDSRPDVRGVVRPITIPPREPPDGVNDSAISSLTLADRDAIVKGVGQERDQEQDRDSDERTQHVGSGQIPSDDDRDVRTQRGKSVYKVGKSKHSDEDQERTGRRRERTKGKNDDSKKLRKEAQGRVAAWLDGIDTTALPATDDPVSLHTPSTSHFVPLDRSESFRPPPQPENSEEHHDELNVSVKDASASPNPRSSGFVTTSTLRAMQPRRGVSPKQSPRRSSANDLPISSSHRLAASQPSSDLFLPHVETSPIVESHLSVAEQANQPAIRLPRIPLHVGVLEGKYDVRSARGGKGGRVTQVASLWAAKAAEANKKNSILPPVRKLVLNTPKQPAINSSALAALTNESPDAKRRHGAEQHAILSKSTTVPAVISSSHAVPMLSSTASLARPHGANKLKGNGLAPMISEMVSDIKNEPKNSLPRPQRRLGDLAFGKARLKALIQKYQS